jgi:acetyltransferase-like isoleucine patch superfamily enzyme
VVSGWVIIGDNCFLGVNATFANGITVGKNCWVNSHTLVTSDIPDQQFVVQPESARKPLDMQRLEEKLREKSSNR